MRAGAELSVGARERRIAGPVASGARFVCAHRVWRVGGFLCVAGLSACGAAAGARYAGASTGPQGPLQATPERSPVVRASAEEGVVTLAEPLDRERAGEPVLAFLAALRDGEPNILASLLLPSARFRPAGALGNTVPALPALRQRMGRGDSSGRSAFALPREDELVTFVPEERAVEGARALAEAGDFWVVVWAPSGAVAAWPFGRNLAFLLRPTRAGYKVAAVAEELLP